MLEVEKLTIAFENENNLVTVVDAVDFHLKPSETLALLGESGCGKSLTSLAMMRLLPAQCHFGPQSSVCFDDTNLLVLPEKVMRGLRGKRLAMIFQEPMTALNPVLSVGQQLAEALLQHQSLTRAELQHRLLLMLQEVEIPEPAICLTKYPHELSGGQKQRIVIAMALANHPEVLIADEPTTALDVTIQAQILALLKKLQQQYQMSLLLITHDLSIVHIMADYVCLMYAGQVVEASAVKDFLKQPLHPYAQQLLVSLPALHKRHQRLQTIPGSVPAFDAMPSGCRFHPRCAHAFDTCSVVEPPLIAQPEDRQVRCHLYPEHVRPPALPVIDQHWGHSRHSDHEIILAAHHLSVCFSLHRGIIDRKHSTLHALNDVSFELRKGKTLALVGESGCGKTTVSRVIMGIQGLTAGQVFYRKIDVTRLRGRALLRFRKQVQIIFQDPFSSMNPHMTISEILAEGLHAQGVRAAKITKRQHELLDQVGLSLNSLHRYPHQFSGGQRQRICIARALATEPEILICDEPTSALDVSVQAQILNLLKTLQYEKELSYLFITHNMSVVSYIADDILVMQSGKIVESGRSQDILEHPTHPYTQRLLSAVLS